LSPPTFHAAAISRLDGGSADGIHLFFEAPAMAGYSIDGFDIQRRHASHERKRRCVALTAGDIAVIEEQLALTYQLGLIELRTGACPVAPRRPTAERERTRTCARFGGRAKATGRNPLTRERATFTVFDEPRHKAAKTALVKAAGTRALQGGVALQIDLPVDADAVELVLQPRTAPWCTPLPPRGACDARSPRAPRRRP
jgi:hypothetical protein